MIATIALVVFNSVAGNLMRRLTFMSMAKRTASIIKYDGRWAYKVLRSLGSLRSNNDPSICKPIMAHFAGGRILMLTRHDGSSPVLGFDSTHLDCTKLAVGLLD